MEARPPRQRDRLLDQCRDTIDSLQADLGHERHLKDQLREQLSHLKETHSAVLEELYTSKAKADSWKEDLVLLQSQFEELQMQDLALQSQLEELQTQNQELLSQFERLKSQEQELKSQNRYLLTVNEGLNTKLLELTNSYVLHKETLSSAQTESAIVREMLDNAEVKNTLLGKENHDLKHNLAELDARLQTLSQLSDREAKDLKLVYNSKVETAISELEAKHKAQTRLDKEKLKTMFNSRLNAEKKEISDFYEEQLVQMRKRLETLTTQLEVKQDKALEIEETLTRTRESETQRSYNWEVMSSRQVWKTELLKGDIDEMTEKYRILLDEYNEAKGKLQQAKAKVKSFEGERKKLGRDLGNLKAEAETLIVERNRATETAKDLERTVQGLRSQLQAALTAADYKAERIAELEEEREGLLTWRQRNHHKLIELEQKVDDEAKTLSSRHRHNEAPALDLVEYVQIIEQLNDDRNRLAKAIEQLETNFKAISMKFNRERSARDSLTKELHECMKSLNKERVLRQQAERELYRMSASPVSSTLA